jgi:sugar/nucleoside kinase (ribokinase family)
VSVVVLGDIMADVVAHHASALAHGSDTAARVELHGGGAAGNVAAWLAYAGTPASLVACVGEDPLAGVALAGLEGLRGVRRVAGVRTGTCVVLVGPDGERTMLPDPGANLELSPDDLHLDGDVLHVSGYTLLRPETRATAQAALALARDRGMPISVDPASAAPLALMPGFLDAMGQVDLLLPNAAEAALLGDRMWDVARAVIVTRGAEGASWSDGDRSLAVAAPAADVVDTTGAGDAFTAGVLSVWPRDPEAALRRGAELAAEAVARPGGRPVAGQ